MSRPDELHARVARLVAGEVDPDSPEGRRLLAEAGIDREEFAALREIASRLDDAAEFQISVAREAEILEGAPGEDRVRATLESLPLPERAAHSVSAPRSRWRLWALAAAVLLIAPLTVQLARWLGGGADRTPEGPGQMLGPEDSVQIEEPVDLGDGVRWHVPRATGFDRFLIVLREGSCYGDELHVDETDGFLYRLPDEIRRTLPPTVYVEIRHLDPGGGTDLGRGCSIASQP